MYKVQTGTTAQPQTSYLRKVLHPYGCSHYSHFSASYQQETYQISPFPSIDPYISNQKIYVKNANKVSIAFEIKHEAGTLYHMLANFYYNDLNLTKIESRPMHKGSWEYRFFVDFTGNLQDSGVENAMASIEEYASNLKIMGNFADKPRE